MCIAVFLWQAHPLYPFILLLNRDEFHARPTKAADWWEEGEILGGRDELAGGTWLACSRSGRIAFLTNFRETDSIANAKSRGDLPVRFLQSKKDPTEFAEEIVQEAEQFNGFNMILVDLPSKAMVYVTNRPKDDKPSYTLVSSGAHVLTSASLDSPWPKAERLIGNFKEVINANGDGELYPHEMIEKLMMNTVKTNAVPGILPPNFEYQLSSIFIDIDTPRGRYGTRSTSAVLAKANGEVCFHERYLEDDSWKEHMITYQIC